MANFFGTQFRDVLRGTDLADYLIGGGGDDELWGGRGDDRLYGDAGNDVLHGEAGADSLFGGDGADRMFGGADNDFLNGGTGGDQLFGDAGNDTATGGDGNDQVVGGDGADAIGGGFGRDVLEGGAGDDLIGSVLYGADGAGADTLTGGGGSDRFFYNDLNDSRGAGLPSIGKFIVSPSELGVDLITDFNKAEGDRIVFGGLIDANLTTQAREAFTFIGMSATPGTGQLSYFHEGGRTILVGNVNANPDIDFRVELAGTVALTAGDFFFG